MLFVPSVWQDIRKYYEGSYVKFAEFGDKLFFIQTVRENEIRGIDEDDEPFVLTLDEEAPYNLTYTLPHKGLFSLDGVAYLLYRVPAQQYSRGITSNNTKIMSVADGRSLSLSFERLRAYVQKQPYVSMEEALFSKSKDVSVCLSRRFSFYRPKQTLYVDSLPIFTFKRKEKMFVPLRALSTALLPEVKALCSTSEKTKELSFQ